VTGFRVQIEPGCRVSALPALGAQPHTYTDASPNRAVRDSRASGHCLCVRRATLPVRQPDTTHGLATTVRLRDPGDVFRVRPSKYTGTHAGAPAHRSPSLDGHARDSSAGSRQEAGPASFRTRSLSVILTPASRSRPSRGPESALAIETLSFLACLREDPDAPSSTPRRCTRAKGFGEAPRGDSGGQGLSFEGTIGLQVGAALSASSFKLSAADRRRRGLSAGRTRASYDLHIEPGLKRRGWWCDGLAGAGERSASS